MFKSKYPKHASIADHLMAIKWIGNAGSHSTNEIRREDVLLGYEILEDCLNKMFDINTDRLRRIGKKIIKHKGVRKGRKT